MDKQLKKIAKPVFLHMALTNAASLISSHSESGFCFNDEISQELYELACKSAFRIISKIAVKYQKQFNDNSDLFDLEQLEDKYFS